MKKRILVLSFTFLSLLGYAQTVKTINLAAGGLSDSLTTSEFRTVTSLTLTGSADARDFRILRDSMTALSVLDLSNVTIAAYTGDSGTLAANGMVYSADMIPPGSFYNADSQIGKETLTSVRLPVGLISIGDNSFKNCTGISKIVLTQTVSTIGNSAFYGCTGVDSVTIPNSVNIIGDYAFSGCSGLLLVDAGNSVYSAKDGILYNKSFSHLIQCPVSKSGNLIIPSSVSSIGISAFKDCKNLTGDLVIPDSVAAIGYYAFENCTGFSGQLFIPLSVQSIGVSAFAGCNGLTKLTVPSLHLADITSFPYHQILKLQLSGLVDARDFRVMRDQMLTLTEVDLTEAKIAAYSGSLGTSGTENYVYPSNTIPDSAFYRHTNNALLTKVLLPVGVESVGAAAFKGCTGLTGSLVFPENLETIGSYAFVGCSGFTGMLTFPSSVTTIGAYAFEGCTGLTSLTATSLHFVDSSAFMNTSILKLSLTDSIDARDFKIMRDNLSLLSEVDLTNATIKEYIGSLGTDTGVSSLYPANTIPIKAFYDADSLRGKSTLTKIELPGNLTSISDFSFRGCTGLTTISIPSTVTTIGNGAFQSCTGLKGGMIIPPSVTSIGISSFQGCSQLTSIQIPASITSIPDSAFSACAGLTGSLIIPPTVSTIGSFAFAGCAGYSGLLTIPSTVQYIGAFAFNNCMGLNSLTSPSLHQAEMTSFQNTGITKVTLTDTIDVRDFKIMRDHISLLSSLDLSSSTIASYLGTQGTAGTNSFFYPANEIPCYAFFYAPLEIGKSSLTNIQFPTGLLSIGDEAFRSCTGLTSLSIPLSITSIGSGVFQGCTGLSGSLVIPSSITSIGNSAFQGCSGFSGTLVIPSSINAVGPLAFFNCTGFTGLLTIPSSITSVGASAFAGCTGINALSTTSLHIADTTSFQNTPIQSVVFSGNVDARDFRMMRDFMPSLFQIDLGNTRIVSYTGNIGTLGSGSFTYPANFIPDFSFYNPATKKGKSGLSAINFPAKLDSIGEDAFRGCIGLTSALVPTSVKRIRSGAFQGCSGLSSSVITTSLTNIGSRAFQDCTGFTGSLTIPSSIKNLEANVFSGCTGLTTITIPSSVLSIGVSAFAGCAGLTNLSAPSLHIADGTSFPYSQISKLSLTGVIDARDFVVMRDSMTVLSDINLKNSTVNAYTGTHGTISSSNLSYPINTIPTHAFIGKTTLSTIQFPLLVDSIGDFAFYGSGLTSVNLPITLKTIGKHAFTNCYLVSSVIIPKTVTKIGLYAFYACSGMLMVDVDNPVYASYDGVLYDKTLTSLIQCPISKAGDLFIPSTVKTIENSAFQDCNRLTGSLIIPSSINSIGINSFYNCTGFSGLLSIPTSVNSIGAHAFENCFGLNSLSSPSLRIADSTSLPYNQFTKVSFVGSIDAGDFKIVRDKMSALADIDFQAATIASYTGTLGTIGSGNIFYPANTIPVNAFYDPVSQTGKATLTSVSFPSGLVLIDNHAFRNCTGLNSLTIPSTVTRLGSNSFRGCTGLTGELVIPSSVTSIGDSAFLACSKLKGLLTIPSSVLYVGVSAFEECFSLTSLTAQSLHIADVSAFNNTPITNVTLTGTLDARDFKFIRDHLPVMEVVDFSNATLSAYTGTKGTAGSGSVYYPPSSIPAYAFYSPDTQEGKKSMTAISFPANLLSIGESAFRGCTGLTSIQIPSSVTSIGSFAFLDFRGSIQVENANVSYASRDGVLYNKVFSKLIQCPVSMTGPFSILPDLSMIGASAFQGCNGITSLRIPSSVHSIGDAAFSGCSGLSSIYSYKTTPVNLTSSVDVFKGINLNSCKLNVPSGSLVWYELADKWKEFLNTTAVESLLLDSMVSPEPGCEGHNLNLSYRILNGEPIKYRLLFNDSAFKAGFRDIPYMDLPTTDSIGVLPLEIPMNVANGSYLVHLQMKDKYGLESQVYPIAFTLNVSSGIILTKFGDVIFCDNSAKRYIRFQWYKNGNPIPGATRQYYSDPLGLVGLYHLQIWTSDLKELTTCPKDFNIPLVSAGKVILSPNPIQKGQSCSVNIQGLSKEDLIGSEMSIYDMKGTPVYHSNDVQPLHILKLSISSGLYMGKITTTQGDTYSFEVLVTE